MKAVVKEEHNAKKVTDEGEGGQNNCRGYRHGALRYYNAAGGGSSGNTPTAKYPTRNKDLPENLVFDNTGHNDAANFQLLSPSRKNPRHGRTHQDRTFH